MNTEQYREYLLRKGYSTKTAASNIRMLEWFIQWLEGENIDIADTQYRDVLAFIQRCAERGNRQQTIQQYVTAIRHYFSFLLHTGEVSDNPASNINLKGIKRKTLHDTFTAVELEHLYKSYPDALANKHNAPPQYANQLARKRNKVMLGLLIYQALRTEELTALELPDVRLREGKIHIRGQRRSNERTLKLEGFQVIDLLDYINETRKALLQLTQMNTPLLFFSKDKGKEFSSVVTSLLKSIRAHNPTVKSLNHIRASVIANWLQHYNLRQVQYMAGHRYVSSTEAYQALNITELQEAIFTHHPIS